MFSLGMAFLLRVARSCDTGRALCCLSLLACTPTLAAEWFTLDGDATQADSDFAQVDVSSRVLIDRVSTVSVRVNFAAPMVSSKGDVYRSFRAQIEVVCSANSLHLWRQTRFVESMWTGRQTDEVFAARRPWALEQLPRDLKEKVLAAACPQARR